MANVSKNEPRIYRTLEEAKEHPRHGKTKTGEVNEWTIWCIASPTGERYYTWSGSSGVALSQTVMDLGWQVYLAEGKRQPVDIKAALDAMPEEQRKELLKEYMKKR